MLSLRPVGKLLGPPRIAIRYRHFGKAKSLARRNLRDHRARANLGLCKVYHATTLAL